MCMKELKKLRNEDGIQIILFEDFALVLEENEDGTTKKDFKSWTETSNGVLRIF